MTRWALAWLPLVALMIGNAFVRESLFAKRVSELRAHQLSTLSGALVVFAYAWIVLGWLGMGTPAEAWTVGALWLGLTVAFEFGFGRFVMGLPWKRLLADYDLRAGRVWSLLLVWILVAPRLILWLRPA